MRYFTAVNVASFLTIPKPSTIAEVAAMAFVITVLREGAKCLKEVGAKKRSAFAIDAMSRVRIWTTLTD